MPAHRHVLPEASAAPFVFARDLPQAGIPISRRMAERLRFERRVSSYLIGKRIAFRVDDLLAWIEEQRLDAQPDPSPVRPATQPRATTSAQADRAGLS